MPHISHCVHALLHWPEKNHRHHEYNQRTQEHGDRPSDVIALRRPKCPQVRQEGTSDDATAGQAEVTESDVDARSETRRQTRVRSRKTPCLFNQEDSRATVDHHRRSSEQQNQNADRPASLASQIRRNVCAGRRPAHLRPAECRSQVVHAMRNSFVVRRIDARHGICPACPEDRKRVSDRGVSCVTVPGSVWLDPLQYRGCA